MNGGIINSVTKLYLVISPESYCDALIHED
jgi:hypothetical protein